MNRRYTAQDHENYRRQQDVKAKRERLERAERSEKASAYTAWIRSGGSPGAFEREWPALRAHI